MSNIPWLEVVKTYLAVCISWGFVASFLGGSWQLDVPMWRKCYNATVMATAYTFLKPISIFLGAPKGIYNTVHLFQMRREVEQLKAQLSKSQASNQ